MGDSQKSCSAERDVEQAITALKKGATLLKYGRRGKPKFCPFRLSNDETVLIWYSGKEEKRLKLIEVSRIIPGQRTAIFQRYPRPEKEYQSFSLIYSDRSLDLICKDKEEAEIWFVALKALTSSNGRRKWRNEARGSSSSADGSSTQRTRRTFLSLDTGDAHCQIPVESSPTGLGKAFSDIMLYTASSKGLTQDESSTNLLNLSSANGVDNAPGRCSTSDNVRVSLSSAVSSSSQGSCHDDFDSLGDVFIWGEGIAAGILGGGAIRVGESHGRKVDALLPMMLESKAVLDVHHIACGVRHAVLVTKQGEIFSWGEEYGGRLGHGSEVDVSHPKLIDSFSGMNVELVACGEYHTCATTTSGDLFTWGDGTCNSGMLGHGSEAGHWIPKRVCGLLDGMHVSYVSCGPWHTAVVVSTGQLFTFGDGTFGVLGHGDRTNSINPKEVEALRGLRTLRVACGTWHTVAIVEVLAGEVSNAASFNRSCSAAGKLYTWGEGDRGQLGHGDKETQLVPKGVAALMDLSFCKVACGSDLTVVLSTSGRVYTMGCAAYGQLGCPEADGRTPACVKGKIVGSFIEDIACGSHHVAAVTSKAELLTWGKGTNGQLGHGDNDHKNKPTFVDFMKDKLVKSVVCGSNFTAAICLHKWASGVDHSTCTGCHNLFGFRRKRHNCYNCGQVFCKACSGHKSLKASLAPNINKPYRVCDDCYVKLKKVVEPVNVRIPRPSNKICLQKSNGGMEKETLPPKFSGLSFVKPLKRNESGRTKDGTKLGKVESTVLPIINDNLQGTSNQLSSPQTPVFWTPNKGVSASAPGSKRVSRATSPISRQCSPVRSSTLIASLSFPTSPETIASSSKHTNDNLRHEVIQLKAEVHKLTSNNQLLEAELEKARQQLREAKGIVANEAEKSNAAKETIQSLIAQLKEMSEKVQGGNSTGCKLDYSGQSSNSAENVSHDNSITSLMSPRTESNMRTMDSLLTNGAKAQPEKTEWVVQEEPGVYITLCLSPGGGNELKRVRFSRKRFSEGQAGKWWSENCTRVCERHNVRSQAT